MSYPGAKQPGGSKWPQADFLLSRYHAAKRTLTSRRRFGSV
jgi:hypothetical protein